ncbi:MFS transporter [Corynebacterium freneyi]|uniref:MFS transporter n=1 Tax=Corynebacterium freneyi TaxID=134034 RepID=UPI00254ABAE8|nr:MFS transporter [Corynebacterium freneyi]MDK8768739.1 MFS transporter [Corynebacterium freneyi]
MNPNTAEGTGNPHREPDRDSNRDLNRDLNRNPYRGRAAVAQSTRTRLIAVLVIGQILGGLGVGAAVSVGALLVSDVSGSPELSGLAATLSTLGAAIASVPLARLGIAKGRGIALATGSGLAAVGAVTATIAAIIINTPLLLVGLLILGVGSAVGLQARFAAADAALPERRGLMLSTVMWSTTVGAVTGPLLMAPSGILAVALGLPELTGPFLITLVAQIAATLLYAILLRPDPLEVARLTDAETVAPAAPAAPAAASHVIAPPADRRIVLAGQGAVAVAHFVMVTLMSMAPLHMTNFGASLTIVGIVMSLHIAGMWALSPVFGWLTDRFGTTAMILAGQAIFLATAAVIWIAPYSLPLLAVALTLLGLGWSASVVAGSAAVTEATPQPKRAAVQGRTDLAMNLAGVAGGLIGGPVLVQIGYTGLALVAMVPVALVVVTHMALGKRTAVTR